MVSEEVQTVKDPLHIDIGELETAINGISVGGHVDDALGLFHGEDVMFRTLELEQEV
jgi:hypothetical protein